MPDLTHLSVPQVAIADSLGVRRASRVALTAILLLGATLRLPGLDAVPPGLHQDEAANAWNAYCLLKTGTDQVGAPWPIFYYRALGEYRSALFLYLLLPFQALGGMNVWTTRLSSAVAGVLTVWLLYWIARRLFDRPTALATALLLALNPTHIQLSRWGHEACITPLLTLAPLAALLWAGLPLGDAQPRPRPLRALLAGLIAGACCYGYPAVRIFVPVYLTTCVLVTGRAWLALPRTRRGVLALLGLGVGVALTFGPLAYVHLAEPGRIGRRGAMTWIWRSSDPPSTRVAKAVERYADHFTRQFLLRTGDADEISWAAGFGFLPWYLLPVLLIGACVVLLAVPRWRAARVLAAGVVLYPIGDALNWHISLHALRTSAGLFALILLAGIGLARPLAFLVHRRARAGVVAAVVAVLGMIVPEEAHFLRSYFRERPTQITVYDGLQADLVAACQWLRPRLDEFDAVVFTAHGFNQPYLIALVSLGHDPQRWFTEPREMYETGMWDRYTRYGRFHFLFREERAALLDRLESDGVTQRVALVLRPWETVPCEPTHVIVGPDGRPWLMIYEVWM